MCLTGPQGLGLPFSHASLASATGNTVPIGLIHHSDSKVSIVCLCATSPLSERSFVTALNVEPYFGLR